MPNEQTYTSYLCTFDEAMDRLYSMERRVLRYAWDIYHHTLRIKEERRRDNRKRESLNSWRPSMASIPLDCLGSTDVRMPGQRPVVR